MISEIIMTYLNQANPDITELVLTISGIWIIFIHPVLGYLRIMQHRFECYVWFATKCFLLISGMGAFNYNHTSAVIEIIIISILLASIINDIIPIKQILRFIFKIKSNEYKIN